MEIKSVFFFVVQVSKQQKEVQVAGAWPVTHEAHLGTSRFWRPTLWEGFAVCPEFCLAEKSGAPKISEFRSILQNKICPVTKYPPWNCHSRDNIYIYTHNLQDFPAASLVRGHTLREGAGRVGVDTTPPNPDLAKYQKWRYPYPKV